MIFIALTIYINELKLFLKRSRVENKGKKFYPYNFYDKNNNIILTVSAERLLTLMQGLGDCTAYMKNKVSPIYIKGDKDEAILMPVRINEEN